MQPSKSIIKVAQFGLGPIGLESLRLLAATPWARVVGGIDIDPGKVGLGLDELTDLPELQGARVHASFQDLLRVAQPDIVLHTAGSSVEATIDQVLPIVEAGVSVATTCEPMLYPWLTSPHNAEMLDAIAEARQVSVVGTGVNPGFVMDLLPIVATGVMRRVDRVYVERVVDVSTRRLPLQRKVGSGMDPTVFQDRFLEGKTGHAGFRESAAMIASAMGWSVSLEQIVETLEPVIATREIETPHFTVEPGQTRGLHQVASMNHEGQEVIRLDLTMALDEPRPHDTIRIEGDHELVFNMPGGIPGDTATVASLINVVPRLLVAQPGLRLMTDLAAPVHGDLGRRGGESIVHVAATEPPRIKVKAAVAPAAAPMRGAVSTSKARVGFR